MAQGASSDPLRPLLQPYPNAAAGLHPYLNDNAEAKLSDPAAAVTPPNRQIGIVIAQRYLSVGTSFYWHLYQYTATTAARFGLASTIVQVSDEQVENGQLPHLLNLLTCASSNKALQLDGLIIMGPFAHDYLKLLAQLPIP